MALINPSKENTLFEPVTSKKISFRVDIQLMNHRDILHVTAFYQSPTWFRSSMHFGTVTCDLPCRQCDLRVFTQLLPTPYLGRRNSQEKCRDAFHATRSGAPNGHARPRVRLVAPSGRRQFKALVEPSWGVA